MRINITTAGRKEDLEILLARGANVSEAAEMLGITQEGLNKWCSRHGLMDLYNRFPKKPFQCRPKKWW